jgi:hypothetical protein
VSLSLITGCLWVIAGAATALLPMPRQQWPGGILFFSAPVLLIWIGNEHGWIWAAFGLFAFVSMFRRFLGYVARKAVGLPAELPPELQERWRLQP